MGTRKEETWRPTSPHQLFLTHKDLAQWDLCMCEGKEKREGY